ncbi:MAG TPA: T9SS type A sorting domain-containing protein [Bacteroidota bacterium]|nr:T9SS type A sorting domain-containing protein [Bacteroidota bacterium]
MKLRGLSFISCLVLFIKINPLYAQWVSTTMPGTSLNEVYALCVKGSDLFAGTVDGVYRSTDNGLTWQEVNPVLPARATQPTVWSMTVNGQSVIAAFSETNVYVTSDDGADWKDAAIPGGMFQTPRVVAASGNYILGGNVTSTTYRSTDNGVSWAQLATPYAVSSIAMEDSVVLACSDDGIYRSTDYGLTWNFVIGSQPSWGSGNPFALSGNRAFAGITSLPDCYVLSSTDAGLTWSDSASLHCNSINSIVISPIDYGNAYVMAGTDSGVFRSSDNGAHWAAANNGLTSTLVSSLAFKTEGTNGQTILFAGTGGGVFFSSDFGDSWLQTLGPSQWTFASDGSDLFAASSNGSYLAGGARGRSSQKFDYKYQSLMYRSTDDGQSWMQLYSGYLDHNAQIASLATARNNSNGLHLIALAAWSPPPYARSNFISLASTDAGSSWATTYDDSTWNLGLMRSSPSAVFVSAWRSGLPNLLVYRSTDEGDTWSSVDTTSVYMRALCSNGDKIYIGGGNEIFLGRAAYLVNLIQVSTDNGATWGIVRSPLDSTKSVFSLTDTLSLITALCSVGPHLIVGMQALEFGESLEYLWIANGGGIYHLVQNDSSWDLANSSLMGRSVFGFATSGSFVFAATDSGIFRSSDYGTNWDDVSLGMNNVFVQSLFVSGSYLFASTSNGLWKRPLSEITSVGHSMTNDALPAKYDLSQNYPNPFNPQTTIKFSIPATSFVSLKIFNVLGAKVATPLSERLNPGTYTANWNASQFASGVYFYRLEAGRFSATKKLLLLK